VPSINIRKKEEKFLHSTCTLVEKLNFENEIKGEEKSFFLMLQVTSLSILLCSVCASKFVEGNTWCGFFGGMNNFRGLVCDLKFGVETDLCRRSRNGIDCSGDDWRFSNLKFSMIQ
jgi:hypothetical protein